MIDPKDMASTHEQYMRLAVKEAEKALEADEVPIGAVFVRDGKIVARAYNQTCMLKDPTAHAEMLAVTQATAALGVERLTDVEVYVTLEPCAMCAGALVLARVRSVIYGAADPKAGACGSTLNVISNPRLNHRIPVARGVLAADCASLLTYFFERKRKKNIPIN